MVRRQTRHSVDIGWTFVCFARPRRYACGELPSEEQSGRRGRRLAPHFSFHTLRTQFHETKPQVRMRMRRTPVFLLAGLLRCAMVVSKDNEDLAPGVLRVSGWREWVGLPELSIRSIKAKFDSGARSSCLHAFDTELFERSGAEWVRFAVHPIQRNDEKVVWCEAPVFDRRLVRSSNGVVSQRVVIRTDLSIFGSSWPIEVTLHNRDAMGFRMLIGREAVRGRFVIDPGGSYYAGRPKRPRRHDKRKH